MRLLFHALTIAISPLLDAVIACKRGGAVGSELGDIKPVSDAGENTGGYQTISPARLDLGPAIDAMRKPGSRRRVGGSALPFGPPPEPNTQQDDAQGQQEW